MYQESFLWKHAYRHRRVEDVLPALAKMPFATDLPHLVEHRAWMLKAYQIRAGMPGVEVPVIAGEQSIGYHEAVSMQIAAHEDDPAAADLVEKLRRVLRPQTIEIVHVDRGIAAAYPLVETALSRAKARIAASRRDYAKAAALARMPSRNILIDPIGHAIDAFLEEGDWRGAAEIAKEHDLRKQKVPPGFDDVRAEEYVRLHNHLAVTAAWSGDDAAAAKFLAEAKAVHRREVKRGATAEDEREAFLWLETLLAGVAEGVLPRKHLHVLTWAFRNAN
jgi:hypothetical protein